MNTLIRIIKIIVVGFVALIAIGVLIALATDNSIQCNRKDIACIEAKLNEAKQAKEADDAKKREAEEKAKAEAEKAEDEKQAVEFAKKLQELPFYCAAAWESKFKRGLRDPDSLSFDYGGVRHAAAKDGTWIVLVPYRAKNGFGGTNVKEAACAYDIATAKVLSVIQ